MIKNCRLAASLLALALGAQAAAAQTALEQAGTRTEGVNVRVTAPSPALPVGALTPAEAREKLRFFDYRKTDVLAVRRGTPDQKRDFSVQKIEFRINDPLCQLGEFSQKFVYYKDAGQGPRPTVLVFSPFSGSKAIDAWAAAHFARRGYNAMLIIPAESTRPEGGPIRSNRRPLARRLSV